ncbi:MAG TPA: hypothetical protein VND66_05215 [Acidobacteriaceae bacterium]|nr:hypothetical protein [Terriglobia bacterium]HVC90006.1 hypothetical protein [Acidobacteriaceae bacterium]
MNQSTNQPSRTSRKSPLLAALLSAVLCGLGQLYNGRVLRGIILFVLMSIVWGIGGFFGALTFGLGMVPFAVVAGALWIFGVVDAYAGSRRINRA